MKKILYLLFILLLSIYYVSALESNEINFVKDKLLNDGISLDTSLYENSIDWKYDLQKKLDEEVKKLNSKMTVYLKRYTYDSCDVVIKYFDSKIFETIEIENIPIKLYGIKFNDDNLILKTNEIIEINPEVLDKNDNKIIIEYYDEESKDIVTIDGNKIKAISPGIATLKIILEDESSYKINIFVDLQKYINKKIDKLNTIELDKGIYGTNYDKYIYNYLLDNRYYSKKFSNTVCINDMCNIDFKIYFRNYEFYVKKESVKINSIGVILNEKSNRIELNENEEYKINYKLYSNSINWYSTNDSIAEVDDEGIIKTISEGACLIIGNTNDNKTVILIVYVKSKKNNIEKYLENLLNVFVHENKTIYIPFVSRKDDIVFKRYLYDYFNLELFKLSNDENINLLYEYDDSLKDYSNLRTIKIGLNYTYNLYYTDDDGITHYYDGDYYSTNMIEIKIIFEDDKSDFDNKILNKSKNILNEIVNKKVFNAYVDIENIEEYPLNNIYFDIEKDNDFIINFHPVEYNDGSVFGYVSISNDGIIYSISEDMITIKNTIKIIRDKELNEDEIINQIEKELNNKDITIIVSKYNDEIYNVKIDNDIDIKVYVEYIDLKVTNIPIVKINKGNDNSLIIEYGKVDYASNYDIYRSIDNKKFIKIINTKDNKYIDENLMYGKTYYYKIKAKNDISESNYSNIVSRKVIPNIVNNIKNEIFTNNIVLSWDKVNVSGLEIYRSIDNKKWSKIKTISKNSILKYNDKNLLANKIYYYKVRSYKKVNNKKIYSEFSEVLTIRTAPKYPKFNVINNGNSLNIIIENVSGAFYYDIYRSEDKEKYIKIKTLKNSLMYEDKGLEYNKTYYYKIKTCNSDNICSNYSNIINKKFSKK